MLRNWMLSNCKGILLYINNNNKICYVFIQFAMKTDQKTRLKSAAIEKIKSCNNIWGIFKKKINMQKLAICDGKLLDNPSLAVLRIWLVWKIEYQSFLKCWIKWWHELADNERESWTFHVLNPGKTQKLSEYFFL